MVPLTAWPQAVPVMPSAAEPMAMTSALRWKMVPRRDVRVDNGCGAIVFTVKKPVSLLVPTAKSLEQPIPAPDESQHDVDHFLCYQVKPQKKRTDGLPAAQLPKKAQRELVDQFQTRRYDLKKVAWLCNPIAKSGTPVLLAGPDKGASVALTPATVPG